MRERRRRPFEFWIPVMDEIGHPDALDLHRDLLGHKAVLRGIEVPETTSEGVKLARSVPLSVASHPFEGAQIAWIRCGDLVLPIPPAAPENRTPSPVPPTRLARHE